MKFRKLSIFFVLVLIAFIAGVGSAHAQMSNEPFQFKNRSGVGGGSVGMSQAHRQMILEQELLNRDTSNPVLRAPDGSLLDYVERDNQIFLRYQGSPFIGSNGGLDIDALKGPAALFTPANAALIMAVSGSAADSGCTYWRIAVAAP